MKIKSIVAAGALGVGFGIVGLVGGAGTANAACKDVTPPLSVPRVECVTNANIATFQDSINPANNLNTLFNGTDTEVCTNGGGTPECHNENDGLGLNDQLGTFASSVGDFFNGPQEP